MKWVVLLLGLLPLILILIETFKKSNNKGGNNYDNKSKN